MNNSKSILNIRNTEDEKCALWCIIAHLFPKYDNNGTNANGQRYQRSSNPNDYIEHENEINTTDIQFPLHISAVGKLEKMNGLAINVFSIDGKANIVPIRISEEIDVCKERTIDLLCVVYGTQSHYCLITNLAGLCRPQATTDITSGKYLCRRCLHFCWREDSFKNHMERCSKHVPQKTLYPQKNDRKGRDKIKFTQISRQLPLPFYFVADFECILQKVDTCLPDPNKSNTTVVNKHVPCGVAYKISCTDPRFYRDPIIITREKDDKSITEQFLDNILHDAREIRKMLQYISPMLPLTPDELTEFDSPHVICHICKIHIKESEIKCKDHDHLTGCYRGPSHQSCNLNYQIKPDKIQIPCFFHNLKNYDAHLIISAAKKRHGEITIIPTTTEKYISFTIGNIIFKDSYAFTQASLDSLTANLTIDQLVNTRRWLENWSVPNDIGEHEEEEEEEEEPNADDIMVIDDYQPSTSTKRKYSCVDSGEDYDDVNAVSLTAKHSWKDQGEEGDPATGRNAPPPPPETFFSDDSEGEEEDDDDDDDEQIDYIIEYDDAMADCDYRRAPHQQPMLTDEQKQQVDDDLQLLKSKGIYPYEYMDSFERFEEREIPPIDAFESSLKAGEGITVEDHAHAKTVFEHFQMVTLQDYHNLYLLQDILLLDDVLTAFRKVCLNAYGLDPMHYYTAPGLTWDAGLKYTGVTLDLITNEDQFLFVEAGIRGGISMISHRHARANHPDLADIGYHAPQEPSCQLLYLDANNLYGFAMMQYLPVSGFKWESQDAINAFSIDWLHTIKSDNDDGYIFEIDYTIPEDKHDKFANYPLAPEQKPVCGNMLSTYQREILREQFRADNDDQLTEEVLEQKIDEYTSTEKLILDLKPKQKYIIHYRTLQLYIKLGMEITKVHRILKFNQQAWLAPYIQANTEMRQMATNDFEKDFFKLMNNAFFGKTMENVRKRRHIDIVSTPEKLKKLVAQPTFKSITTFREDLSAVERIKAKVTMNKPIYIGLCVLELSKWLMYDFYYNVLHQIFPPSSIRLLFTDTDSLCISIEGTDDIYQRIRKGVVILENGQREPAINFFDLSGYPSEHSIFNGMSEVDIEQLKKSNKKVPGKMKDELNGNVLIEFVGLRAKAYAFQKLILFSTDEDETIKVGEIVEEKKLKGIQKCVVKRNLNFNHYKSALFKKKIHIASTTSLRSHLHEIRTLAIRKVAMGPYDDKRYLLEDGISSLPYGHYCI